MKYEIDASQSDASFTLNPEIFVYISHKRDCKFLCKSNQLNQIFY